MLSVQTLEPSVRKLESYALDHVLVLVAITRYHPTCVLRSTGGGIYKHTKLIVGVELIEN